VRRRWWDFTFTGCLLATIADSILSEHYNQTTKVLQVVSRAYCKPRSHACLPPFSATYSATYFLYLIPAVFVESLPAGPLFFLGPRRKCVVLSQSIPGRHWDLRQARGLCVIRMTSGPNRQAVQSRGRRSKHYGHFPRVANGHGFRTWPTSRLATVICLHRHRNAVNSLRTPENP
jgi:hypothetical protein